MDRSAGTTAASALIIHSVRSTVPAVTLEALTDEAAKRAHAEHARDCRRGDGRAAVMQVRPLSVVSGTARSSPFGRSPFGASGWL